MWHLSFKAKDDPLITWTVIQFVIFEYINIKIVLGPLVKSELVEQLNHNQVILENAPKPQWKVHPLMKFSKRF